MSGQNHKFGYCRTHVEKPC